MALTLSAIQKRNLSKVLPFAFFAMGAGFLFALIEKGLLGDSEFYPSTGNYYDFGVNVVVTLVSGFLLGVVVGILEALVINRIFGRASFFTKVFIKSLIYVVLIVLIISGLGLMANAFQMGKPFYSREVLATVINFVTNFAFVSIVIYVGGFITIMLFISELSDYLGQGAFRNYFLGKYHRSRQEERIFMFLDMRSSTAIAEQLGHVRYFEFLNLYYSDIVEVILQAKGEIYQYVGDEVIVSWPVGGEQNRFVQSLDCFYAIREMMDNRKSFYKDQYGIVPDFKAGMHYGFVTTGEIGQIKKDIVFTGDILNTTARIQGRCNEFNQNLLISGALKEMVISNHPEYSFDSVGEIELRGKQEAMELYAVSPVE